MSDLKKKFNKAKKVRDLTMTKVKRKLGSRKKQLDSVIAESRFGIDSESLFLYSKKTDYFYIDNLSDLLIKNKIKIPFLQEDEIKVFKKRSRSENILNTSNNFNYLRFAIDIEQIQYWS